MKLRRAEYVSILPGVVMAAVSVVCIGLARLLQRFDEDRPDLGD